MLRDLADRVESGEVEPRQMHMGTPVAQFAPPGVATYDDIHTGEISASLELAWEDKRQVDAFWEKVNGYGGLLPVRTI